MYDLELDIPNTPGALAKIGEVMGKAGIPVEGGGVIGIGERAIAHFLFRDGRAAERVAQAAGVRVVAVHEPLIRRLKQGTPGQLGAISRALADAGVNIVTQYSDHHNRLILICDQMEKAANATEAWSDKADPRVQEETLIGKRHRYATTVKWSGNTGTGTKTYSGYNRTYDIVAKGKPPIAGSSDPAFRGDAHRWNPEELLVASLSACHKLWFLGLCSQAGVVVTAYEDAAEGSMIENANGAGQFESVILRPHVTISAASDEAKASELHEQAHAMCFIARSVNFSVTNDPTITCEAAAA